MVGIYKVENLAERKIYIGQSINTEQRMKGHISNLRGGYHIISLLQEDFQRLGEGSFGCEVIHECEEDELFRLERNYIYFFLGEGYTLYNCTPERISVRCFNKHVRAMLKLNDLLDNGDIPIAILEEFILKYCQ